MNELTLPVYNLISQPIRAAITILGIAVAIGGFVALTGLSGGLAHSFDRGLGESGADLIVTQRDAYSILSSSVPESLGAVIAKVDGVDRVSGTLLTMTSADSEANIVIAGWPSGSFLWQNLPLVDGRVPHEIGEVVLGEAIARSLKKRLGDKIEFQFESFTVVGIASFATPLNQNMAIVELASLQKLLGRSGAVTLFQVHMARPLGPDRIAVVHTYLSDAVARYAVYNTEQFASNIRFFHIIQTFTSAISIIVLGTTLFGVANTLLMAVSERTYELGILGAIGWSPGRILRLILIEGEIIAAIGGILGIGLGIAAMAAIARTHLAAGVLELHLTPGLIAEALISASVIGPLGALYPAWRATRLKPAEALRAH
jgi:putative ABC transport system permease protein